MSTIDTMRGLVTDLTSSSITIPGLDFDSIVDNLIKNVPDYKAALASVSEEEKPAIIAAFKKDYETRGRQEVEKSINKIKTLVGNVQAGISQTTEQIETTVASMVTPSVIGSAAPNPLYIIMDAKIKKNAIKTSVDSLTKDMVELLNVAIDLYFPLPDYVLAFVEAISLLRKGIDLIVI